ncbi:iron-binding CDGSH zinc finger protein [Aquimarina intermedia]|uniref:Iron-binding CDGSH zinc finger protein n=1 Tax=Aquimarina intermedia TaxID=350814 RepID=A0A5S5C0J0_9FLAO|nr:iron-binding CDGSH zinc finger protein [Aquimarina intermedia]
MLASIEKIQFKCLILKENSNDDCSLLIQKYTMRILDGKGLNDCVCGQSKRMPNCDGSHKQIAKAL